MSKPFKRRPHPACLYCAIRLWPGRTMAQLSRIMRVPYWMIWDRMTALEDLGYLVYQDERKRLYAFDGDSYDFPA